MKGYQSKLSIGASGNVLVDATNKLNKGKLKETTNLKKRKSENVENLKPTKVSRKDGIYVDDSSKSECEKRFIDKEIQTEAVEISNTKDEKAKKINDMLTSENTSAEYWATLAENRREALEITLEENRLLVEENKMLKEENKLMEDMLDEAKKLAEIVTELPEMKERSLEEKEKLMKSAKRRIL